ncbi:hypothetical protein D3C72_2484150 [compost metagenome]
MPAAGIKAWASLCRPGRPQRVACAPGTGAAGARRSASHSDRKLAPPTQIVAPTTNIRMPAPSSHEKLSFTSG